MTKSELIRFLEPYKRTMFGDPKYGEVSVAEIIEALEGQGDRCITTSLRLWADKVTENGLIDRKRILQSITDYCELHGVSVETWIVRLITEEPQVEALEGQTCDGCKHKGQYENEYENGYNSPCTVCKRRARDNYFMEVEHE